MTGIRSFSFALCAFALTLAVDAVAFAQSTQTILQYQYAATDDGYDLALREVPRPVASAGEVLVRVRATSLNRRDVGMLYDRERLRGNLDGTIPLSDGAGEIVAVGSDVTRFAVGDRVVGIFSSSWIDGKLTAEDRAKVRGGTRYGMLSEIVVTSEESLLPIPDHLSFEEAATLPCAGVTAWNALFKHGNLLPGEYVLLEGTGGVSTFGLQFAAAAGAIPIITSSSNDKLARARELGAVGTVNYRENEDWQVEVRALTNDKGVHHVLEIGGRDTLVRALQTLALGSHIAVIGALSGALPALDAGQLIMMRATASGVWVGSRADFERMNAFIIEHQLHPVVDRVFDFDEAPEAFDFMENGDYMGKIVITL